MQRPRRVEPPDDAAAAAAGDAGAAAHRRRRPTERGPGAVVSEKRRDANGAAQPGDRTQQHRHGRLGFHTGQRRRYDPSIHSCSYRWFIMVVVFGGSSRIAFFFKRADGGNERRRYFLRKRRETSKTIGIRAKSRNGNALVAESKRGGGVFSGNCFGL